MLGTPAFNSAGTELCDATQYAGGAPVTEMQGSTFTAAYTIGNDLLRRNGEYPAFDGAGSARAETNSSGTATATQDFDAFGNTIASSGSTGSPYNFAGDWAYQSNGDAGLQHVGARYYDPQVGRFASRDSMLGGPSYSYCCADPVNCADPTGDWCFSVGVSAIAILFIGVNIGGDINVGTRPGGGYGVGLSATGGLDVGPAIGAAAGVDVGFNWSDPIPVGLSGQYTLGGFGGGGPIGGGSLTWPTPLGGVVHGLPAEGGVGFGGIGVGGGVYEGGNCTVGVDITDWLSGALAVLTSQS